MKLDLLYFLMSINAILLVINLCLQTNISIFFAMLNLAYVIIGMFVIITKYDNLYGD